ncbi:hypothetical protein FB451DRAFT_1535346, partial [Mycena latifolia]
VLRCKSSAAGFTHSDRLKRISQACPFTVPSVLLRQYLRRELEEALPLVLCVALALVLKSQGRLPSATWKHPYIWHFFTPNPPPSAGWLRVRAVRATSQRFSGCPLSAPALSCVARLRRRTPRDRRAYTSPLHGLIVSPESDVRCAHRRHPSRTSTSSVLRRLREPLQTPQRGCLRE